MPAAVKNLIENLILEKENEITPAEFDEIERYLLQQMSDTESAAFSRQLNDNATLSIKVDDTRLLLLGVKEGMLAEKMKAFHLALKTAQPSVSDLWIKRYLAAAVVFALLILGSWLFFSRNGSQKMYSDYYIQDAGLMTVMGVSENYNFDKAMIDYKLGDYQKAIDAWQKLLITNPANDTLHYFIGSAYMALDQPARAFKNFEWVMKSVKSNFKMDAYWYAGLSLLKQGEQEKASNYIRQSDNSKKDELLARMKLPATNGD